MWFENPFHGNEPNNLALLLRNLGAKQGAEQKRSTTVDVWRGNYSDFTQPKPKITIIKKCPDPKTEIAETKTLYPARDAPAPSPRTLLCHHATDKSGHITCDYPGKCNIHKLTKPSAFEVSKLDQCRTVIDLYEQGVMSGAINAEQRVSRDAINQKYSKVEYGNKCTTHQNCNGDCGSHGSEISRNNITTKPGAAALVYTPDTRPDVAKQMVVSRKPNSQPSTPNKLATYGNQPLKSLVKEHQGLVPIKKHVTFNDPVKVKCVNPNCGRLSILGESCENEVSNAKSDMVTLVKQDAPPYKEPVCETEEVDVEAVKAEEDQSCLTEQKLLPTCYYQHARQRMKRLKEKSKTLVEKVYAPPSSLATPGVRHPSLVKKYNTAKQKSLKRKKFVIPNVSADSLYQPTKPRRPKTAPPMFYTSPKPPPPQYTINMREVYPRKRTGKMKIRRSSSYPAGQDEERPTIKVAVDDVGPLVYAVQNGKIERMTIEGSTSSCRLEI